MDQPDCLVLIPADAILSELADLTPCPDCLGGLGVHIDTDGEWAAVVVHDVTCPAIAADLPH